MLHTLASSVWAPSPGKGKTSKPLCVLRSTSGNSITSLNSLTSSLKKKKKTYPSLGPFPSPEMTLSNPLRTLSARARGGFAGGSPSLNLHSPARPRPPTPYQFPASSSDTMDEEEKQWVDHVRRYPTLHKFLGSVSPSQRLSIVCFSIPQPIPFPAPEVLKSRFQSETQC